MHRLIAALGLVAAMLTAPSAATAQEALVVKESPHGVKETIDRVAAAVEKRGAKVVARVDHAAGAKAVNMELRPTEVILFGNPKLGTPLMQAEAAIGIDLPLKILAWQAADGKVWVGYPAPTALQARHGVKGRDEAFAAMAAALAGIVAEAVVAK